MRKSTKNKYIDSLVALSIEHYNEGDLINAKKLCKEILKEIPWNPDAKNILGLICCQTGNTIKSIKFFKEAISTHPNNPIYYNNLGLALKTCGDLKKSKNCFKKALYLKCDYPEALYNIGGIYYFEKKYELSISYYKKAIKVRPQFKEALNNLAATLNSMERYNEAIEYCKKAIEINSNYSEAINNMGNAYKGLRNIETAIECYRKALKVGGKNAEVLCNYANALILNGYVDNAIQIYKEAIEFDPYCGIAYNNIGTAYRSKRKLKEAERKFRKCISLFPEDHEAYHNIGNLNYDKGEFDLAKKWYEKALRIQPKSVQTLINIGIVYQEIGKSNNALDCFKKAVDLDPLNPKVICHIVHEYYQRCEWKQLNELNISIDFNTDQELKKEELPNEMPFLSLIRKSNEDINYKIACAWSKGIVKSISGNKERFFFKHCNHKRKKLTIGYFSNNIRNHPTAQLIKDIFPLHDRNMFNINVYSYGQDDRSKYREKIVQNCDQFIDLKFETNEAASKRIYSDAVDILVDLVGYMHGNRMEICAYRPAPIQVRWLGLAGTTGADFYDYLITDKIVTPESSSQWYSEKFVYMPDTYQVNSKPINQSETRFSRIDLGLPESTFVFCCFCSNYKIEPVMFGIWMDILKETPNSVLWILRSNILVEENLKKEAVKRGIDSERLVFSKKMNKEDHLKRISLADLALDTRIVNGAATTSDSLYAGVPVLSLKGTHFASRMSASILNAVGLRELVVDTEYDYKKKAIEYGNNRAMADRVKTYLRTNLSTMPLFDTNRFVQNLERAYIKMWKRYIEKKSPDIIYVE